MEHADKIKKMLIFFISKYKGITDMRLQNAMLVADRYHWGKFGKSVSGIDYVRADRGPVMSGDGDSALLSLEKNGDISAHEQTTGGYDRREYRTDREISDDEFSSSELEALNFALDTLRKYGARQLSDMTRDDAWRGAKNGEVIPYETAVCYEISDTAEITDENMLKEAVENLGKARPEF